MIHSYREKRLRAGVSPRTVNLDTIDLRNVLKHARDQELIERLPVQADAPPSASPRQLAWLLLQPAAKLDAWQRATITQVEQDSRDFTAKSAKRPEEPF